MYFAAVHVDHRITKLICHRLSGQNIEDSASGTRAVFFSLGSLKRDDWLLSCAPG